MTVSLSVAASRTKVKSSGESILFGFDFGPLLRSGETISSVTSVTCTAASGTGTATSDLTIGTGTVNDATFENDEGGTVAISEGVKARISGGVNGGDYTIRCRVATSQSDTRDIIGTLQVRDS